MSAPARLLEPAGRVLDSLDDLDVARAAAQMADQCFADVVLARIRVLVQQRLGGEDETRRAESALHAAFLHERCLDLIENPAFGETFDRLDVLALRLHREIEARVDRLAVDQDRAGAALTFLAGAFGAREADRLPQRFEQRAPGRDENVVGLAVDAQADGQQVFHGAAPFAAFSRAARRARLVRLLNSSKRNSRVARQDVRGSASSQTASAASSSTSSAQARPRKTASAFLARIGTGALLDKPILTSRNTRLPWSQVTKALTPTVVMSIDWRSWNFK